MASKHTSMLPNSSRVFTLHLSSFIAQYSEIPERFIRTVQQNALVDAQTGCDCAHHLVAQRLEMADIVCSRKFKLRMVWRPQIRPHPSRIGLFGGFHGTEKVNSLLVLSTVPDLV